LFSSSFSDEQVLYLRSKEMLKIVDAKTMQTIDRKASEEYGIPGYKLMEQAGKRLASHVLRFTGSDSRIVVSVLAGGGKNGGDGLVCARYLARAGVKVMVWLLAEKLVPETKGNLQRLASENVPVKQYSDPLPDDFFAVLKRSDCIVDALLGIGISGTPREPMATAIHACNNSRSIVVAADIPSGLNADTGEASEPTIRAHSTIAFGLPKHGLLRPEASAYTGQVRVETIGFPEALLCNTQAEIQYCDKNTVAMHLPQKAANAHKRSCGKVLVIGGSSLYHGAVLLAALGAKKAGAGYVSIAYPKMLDTSIRSQTLEEVCLPMPCSPSGVLGMSALPMLLESSKEADAVVLGPGLGRAKQTLELIKLFIQQAKGPRVIVIDADALHGLPGLDLGTRASSAPVLALTPHEGEASVLLEKSVEAIQHDRKGAAKCIGDANQAVVLLKGQHTVVYAPKEVTTIVGSGTQALATAGTGDVLSGVIAAMAAHGLEAYPAAWVGASIQGIAGELSSCDPLGLGVTASQVAEHVPQAIRYLRKTPKNSMVS
jgi:ADP-dependent NAD(P)H-hydrate dehydratase / NAD(P)H-hydrate epimerase